MRIKNWERFQHYKKRRPPWIKLYRDILDDRTFQSLPVASRALAPCMWLLASEYPEGEIPFSPESLAWRLRQPLREINDGLNPLIDKGFIVLSPADNECASTVLASCEQYALSETETETEKRERRASKFTPPTPEEVMAYCKERKNHVNPEKWIAFYQSNGWRVGRNPMKDWKSAVVTWEKNNFGDGNGSGHQQSPSAAYPSVGTQRSRELAERKAQGL